MYINSIESYKVGKRSEIIGKLAKINKLLQGFIISEKLFILLRLDYEKKMYSLDEEKIKYALGHKEIRFLARQESRECLF